MNRKTRREMKKQIKKLHQLEDNMFIYTIGERYVGKREFEKEVRKWIEKQKEN